MSTIHSKANTTPSTEPGARMTGKFPNLDTDLIVNGTTFAQQSKIDAVKCQQTKQEWFGAVLSGVKADINEFLNTYVSHSGSFSMLNASAYATYKAMTSSTSGAVKVTASGSAQTGDLSIQINQLAKNATVSSSGNVSNNGIEISSNNTTPLESLSFETKLNFNANGNISFAINGKTFSFSKDTTLQNMINTINNDKNVNVTMKYSRLKDAFTITANSGGADGSVSVTNLQGNAFGKNSAFKIGNGTFTNGMDSEVVINGATSTWDSNDFTIDGITYALKEVTQNTSEEKIDFTLERDYSAAIRTITKFVDAYNKLFNKLKNLDNETDYTKTSPPLTDMQKEEMSTEAITDWEAKAKSGLLCNNQYLSPLISGLKSIFSSPLGHNGLNVSEIGIKTAGYSDATSAEIVIDMAVLTQALKNDPEEVIGLFTTGNSNIESEQQCLIYKIRNTLVSFSSKVSDTMKISTAKIKIYDTQISALEDKLDKLADKYYEKFSIMDTALSRINTQSSCISQMFQ